MVVAGETGSKAFTDLRGGHDEPKTVGVPIFFRADGPPPSPNRGLAFIQVEQLEDLGHGRRSALQVA